MTEPALLLLDLQAGILRRYGTSGQELLGRLLSVAESARSRGVAVVHVRLAFRAGHPEVSLRNRSLSSLAESGEWDESHELTQIDGSMDVRPGDLIVTRRRISAFVGTDLELLLRSLGVTHLVLGGIATSGAILSTVRQAADHDFDVTVLKDGCIDADPEVNRVLLDKILPRQAEVITIDEWVAAGGPRERR